MTGPANERPVVAPTPVRGADEKARAVAALDSVRRWAQAPAMTELVALVADARHDQVTASVPSGWLHLNEELPEWLTEHVESGAPAGFDEPYVETLTNLLALEESAARLFNFRSLDGQTYVERSQAATVDLDDDVRARILALADALGLVTPTTPRFVSYDKTLVLGGGYRSPLLRSRYAATVVAGGVAPGDVYFLGSPRFLIEEPPESPAVADYAPDATDEFGLMAGAAAREFGLRRGALTFLCGCRDDLEVCPSWREVHGDDAAQTPAQYTHRRALTMFGADETVAGTVLSAATGRPSYRPDTSDTFALWSDFANPLSGQRILVITTQVFVPFQTFDAVRRLYLTHGVAIDTVGFGADWGDRPQTAEYLLQEVLSALRSARRLAVSAAVMLRSG